MRRKLRLASVVVAVPLLAVGSAFLADNSITTSHAGDDHVKLSVATTLAAISPPDATVKLQDPFDFSNVAVRLTTVNGTAVAGKTITFVTDTSKAGVGVICHSTTDANGDASCPNDTQVPADQFSGAPTRFIATFAGASPLQPSITSGELTQTN